MAFIDTRLDECVAYGFTGGPEWSTMVVQMDNGREQRNGQWMYPRHRYAAQYMNLNAEGRDAILSAFHAARGQLHVFRFKDWNDFEAVDQPLAPVIGTTTPVQLVKTYSLGTQTSTRLVQAPLPEVVIRRNGTAVAGMLDTQTGLFTPANPWVAGNYTWSGPFDVWVRFASDYNAFAIGSWNAHTADIELVEVRR